MKKSTGILFLVAVILGASVYFYERHQPKPAGDAVNAGGNAGPNEGARPTYDIKQEDIAEITVTRAGMPMVFDLKSDGWHITQPISSLADQAALGDLANTLSILPQDRAIANPSAADMNTYGLVNPAITVEFKMRNGATHKMQIGAKDFSNLEVYALVDGSKNVALVSNIIVNTIDKPLDAFRNHMVFTANPEAVTAFELDNEMGMISAKKDDTGWTFTKPLATPGSTANIIDMFGNLAMANIASFASDNANDLAKYGLANPAIRLRATLSDGSTKELIIGKKEGKDYDAQDTSQPVIFRVPESARAILNQSLADLRAKALFTGQDDAVARVEVHNQYGDIVCAKDSTGALVIQQAGGKTGPACPDFTGVLERATSGKITDQPPAALTDKLAKPAIQVSVTDQYGKKTDIQISAPAGNSVYGRSSAGTSIYEFDKGSFDDLNYNPASK